jgi:hypothetical protein
LGAAEYQRVVQLLTGALDSMREPTLDVIGFLGTDEVEMVAPGARLRWIASARVWPAVEVDHAYAPMVDPSAIGDDPVVNDQWFVRVPGHLHDGAFKV